MRAVNLLPHDEVAQRRQLGLTPQNAPVMLGAGLGVVVVGALALGFMHESGAVSTAQKQLEQAKVQLANTPKPPPPTAAQAQPNAQLVGEQSARVSALSNALGARLAWDRILREFSLVLPDDVWLSSLAFQGPGATSASPAGATGSLTIAGTTYSHDSVARLLARLALIPELSAVTLQSDSSSAAAAAATPGLPAATTAPPAATTISFTISAAVNLPAGATSLVAPPPAPPPPPPTDTTATTTGSTS